MEKRARSLSICLPNYPLVEPELPPALLVLDDEQFVVFA
jgi:hypothetical protein